MGRERSEQRIRNNRIKRMRELRRHVLMGLAAAVLAVGFSLLFFSAKIKAQENEAVQYKYYKSIQVEEGDTLWNYASLYGDNQHYDSYDDYIKEVMNMNALSQDKITTGQYLILPYYSADFIE
ncbi:MAG: LysM peptidoglycan-binding domain-containing protein [Clostridium sp.]|nr:LysM peptidoglycan-binding domain-containing protein [Clostridium sp.]